MDYQSMTDEQLAALKRQAWVALDTARKEGRHPDVMPLRNELLAIVSIIEGRELAARAAYAVPSEGISATIAGEAAAAVSEAERIIGG